MEEKELDLLELACKERNKEKTIDSYNLILNKTKQGLSDIDVFKTNPNGENFFHLLTWFEESNKGQEELVLEIVNNLEDFKKLDLLKPNLEGETFLHYLLDEDNNISNKTKKKIVKSFFNDMPIDLKLTILNIKDENQNEEVFNINREDKSENIAQVIAYQFGEDTLLKLLGDDIRNFNFEEKQLFENLLSCVDEDNESLYTTLTDQELGNYASMEEGIQEELNIIKNKKQKKLQGKTNEH